MYDTYTHYLFIYLFIYSYIVFDAIQISHHIRTASGLHMLLILKMNRIILQEGSNRIIMNHNIVKLAFC
jgi:hypothetical protein